MSKVFHIALVVGLDEVEVILRCLLAVDSSEDVEASPLTEWTLFLLSLFPRDLFAVQRARAIVSARCLRSHRAVRALRSLILLSMALLILPQEVGFLYPHYPRILLKEIDVWVLDNGHGVIVPVANAGLEPVPLWLLATDPFTECDVEHCKVR